MRRGRAGWVLETLALGPFSIRRFRRTLGLVWTVCSTTKLTGLFSLTIVSVPSTCELDVSFVFGLKIAASTPAPIRGQDHRQALSMFQSDNRPLVSPTVGSRRRDILS